jgi:subtilisin family serine protease
VIVGAGSHNPKDDEMKTIAKISCLATAAMLVFTSALLAGETKPLKGTLFNGELAGYPLDELPYDPFFEMVMDEMGAPPDYATIWSGETIQNVGGKGKSYWFQIHYASSMCGSGITVLANGDSYTWNLIFGPGDPENPMAFTFEIFIPGIDGYGTGRFEGVEGWCEGGGTMGGGSYFEGWITTVGSSMSDKSD